MDNAPFGGRDRELLKALQSLGAGWHSRTAIAAKLGRKRLNPGDVVILDVLSASGKVEKQLGKGPRPNVAMWEYRLKG